MTAILRKYGESATINFTLFEVDGIDFRVDAVHASGDSSIMKDEGAEANTTNSFTDEGNGYSLVLTATEMQAARIKIYLVDQTATKVWLDASVTIETYGNISAQHAFDLDTALVTLAAVTHTGAVIPIVTTNTDMKVGNSPQSFNIAKGATSQIIQFSAYDISDPDGEKLTGLVFNTASLAAHYNRTGAAGSAVEITLVTATKGTFTSGGFIAVDATNQPGEYELHVPDAALIASADRVTIIVQGAANLKPVTINIELVAEIDLGSDGRVLVSANTHTSGQTVADVAASLTVDTLGANTITAASIAASAMDGKGDWNIGKTGYSLTQNFPTNFASLGISAGGAIDNVTLVATTDVNSDMVAEAPTFSQIWTTQLTESYAADGVAPTPAQTLFITMQNQQSFSFSGTTQIVRRIDDSTTAATYTLDDATNPTAKERAS